MKRLISIGFVLLLIILSFGACSKNNITEDGALYPRDYSLSKVRLATSEEIAKLPKLEIGDGLYRTLTCQWEGGLPTGTCTVNCSDGDHCAIVQHSGSSGTQYGIGCYAANNSIIRTGCYIYD
jgi:hypothetical protein